MRTLLIVQLEMVHYAKTAKATFHFCNVSLAQKAAFHCFAQFLLLSQTLHQNVIVHRTVYDRHWRATFWCKIDVCHTKFDRVLHPCCVKNTTVLCCWCKGLHVVVSIFGRREPSAGTALPRGLFHTLNTWGFFFAQVENCCVIKPTAVHHCKVARISENEQSNGTVGIFPLVQIRNETQVGACRRLHMIEKSLKEYCCVMFVDGVFYEKLRNEGHVNNFQQ